MAEQKKKILKFPKINLSRIALPKPTFKDTPMNGFLVIALVIFAFLLGLLTNKVIYLEQQVKNPTATTTTATQETAPQVTVTIDQIKELFNSGKHITFGDANAKNLIVEIADPSCPYCQIAGGHNPELSSQAGPQFTPESQGGTYVPPLPEIEKMVNEGKAAFVWIYFPGHGNGEMGTKALYCAQDIGKFWEVHNKLMTNAGHDLLEKTVLNDKTKTQELVNFLADVADANALKSCIDSGKYDARLTEDSNVATGLSIQGTPGFFINETPFPGAYSWKDMESSLK